MRALLITAGLCSIAVSAAARSPRPDPGPLAIARQGSFFVGGRDVTSDTLSTLPAYAAVRHHHRRPDVRALPGPRRRAWRRR